MFKCSHELGEKEFPPRDNKETEYNFSCNLPDKNAWEFSHTNGTSYYIVITVNND